MDSGFRACEEIDDLISNPSLRGAQRRSNPGARGRPHAVRWIASPAARNDGLEDRFLHKLFRRNDD
jgi:hypothetical protein